jgi:hypothetical protein
MDYVALKDSLREPLFEVCEKYPRDKHGYVQWMHDTHNEPLIADSGFDLGYHEWKISYRSHMRNMARQLLIEKHTRVVGAGPSSYLDPPNISNLNINCDSWMGQDPSTRTMYEKGFWKCE